MTTPPAAKRKPEWWTRPSVILPVVATIAVMVALVSPQAASGRFGDPRLSSHLAGSMGARLLADVAGRLGWRIVQRDSQAVPDVVTGRTLHAVLAPRIPVTPTEAHAYLEAVRQGDALLIALDTRNALSDSLGVTHYMRGDILVENVPASAGCGRRLDLTPPFWPDGRVHLAGVRLLRDIPGGYQRFAPVAPTAGAGKTPEASAAIGFEMGKGRVVVVGDPDLLRNDVIRRCVWGADVIAVDILEWLRAGGPMPRTTLAFDEYHQGYSPRPGVMGISLAFLVEHPVGRVILQVVVASLVLLLAVAPRAIVPADVERIERRNPLEQVDALAHAYEQVRATRTVTERLLRGVRWRVERGHAARSATDDTFLGGVSARVPALAHDVDVVRHALAGAVTDAELLEAGAALHNIELTLTTTIT